jgi:hypothetical protein
VRESATAPLQGLDRQGGSLCTFCTSKVSVIVPNLPLEAQGWCPPPAHANTPCIAASATSVADRAYVSTTAKGASGAAARPQAPAGVWLGCCLVGVIRVMSATDA